MKPSVSFTFIRRVIYLIMDAYREGQMIDICMDCLSRHQRKKIHRNKRGFQLMWWEIWMQIEYSRYVRDS